MKVEIPGMTEVDIYHGGGPYELPLKFTWYSEASVLWVVVDSRDCHVASGFMRDFTRKITKKQKQFLLDLCSLVN